MSNRHQKLNKTKAKLQALGHPVYHVPLAGHFCIDGNCINPRTKHLQVCLALSPKHLKSPRIPHQPPITTLCQLDVCMAFFGGGSKSLLSPSPLQNYCSAKLHKSTPHFWPQNWCLIASALAPQSSDLACTPHLGCPFSKYLRLLYHPMSLLKCSLSKRPSFSI
jgi:hypothetical protein